MLMGSLFSSLSLSLSHTHTHTCWVNIFFFFKFFIYFAVKGGLDCICGEAWVLFWCCSQWTCHQWWGNCFNTTDWSFHLLPAALVYLKFMKLSVYLDRIFLWCLSYCCMLGLMVEAFLFNVRLSIWLLIFWIKIWLLCMVPETGLPVYCRTNHSYHFWASKGYLFCLWPDRCVEILIFLAMTLTCYVIISYLL